MGYHAEDNEEIARLVAWNDEHRYATVRLTHRPNHRGHLSILRNALPDGSTRTIVRVRDSRKGPRSQYQTILSLANLEIKQGARYANATKVVQK